MQTLKQAYGNWVAGDRFWDREEDIALFVDRITSGANLLLVAQRRMGKTSLMREVSRRLEDRYLCLFVDLQKCKGAPDAVVELSLALVPHQRVWERVKEVFGNVLACVVGAIERVEVGEIGVTLRAGLTAGDWVRKGDQLLSILASAGKPVLLLFDEVPILVNRILKAEANAISADRRAAADEFLSWLRENSLRHQGRVQMVLSGSIGLAPILRQANLSTVLNSFSAFELRAWDGDTAKGCLQALGAEYGLRFEKGAEEKAVGHLGCCIPHHVQMYFTHLHDRCRRTRKTTISAADVDEVYATEMLSVRGHVELSHYEERLKLVLGEGAFTLAAEMLTEAAVTGHLGREGLERLLGEYSFPDRTTREAQEEVLLVLEHDGYLEPGPDGYSFVSRLVRDWWRARHGQLYTPVLRREG